MIGKYRLIPAGTYVWSCSLQERISFEEDVVVIVTNTIHGNDDIVFGCVQLMLFMTPVDKANGEISFSFSETTKYKIPKSPLLNIV